MLCNAIHQDTHLVFKKEKILTVLHNVYIVYIHMKEADFSNITGFEWDEGNLNKNWDKHHVSSGECEEVFFNEPYFTFTDEKHSAMETRYYALGETSERRRLFVVFTIRKKMVRVISARDMNRNERKAYENLKKNPEI